MADNGFPPIETLSLSNTVEQTQRVQIKSILLRPDGGAGLVGQTLKVGGWVKKGREQDNGSIAVLELNDGSCSFSLKLIIYSDLALLVRFTPTGTGLHVEGVLQADKHGKQSIQLKVSKVLDVGPAYLIPETKLMIDFFRDFLLRINTFSFIARICKALAFSTCTFFKPLRMADNGIHPIETLALFTTVEQAKYSQRVSIKSILLRPDGGAGLAGQTIKVGGWVKKGREQGKGSFAFLELNDGSCGFNLQLILYSDVAEPLGQFTPTGTCLHVEGVLQMPPADKKGKQSIELKVTKVLKAGPADPAKYPIPKTKLSLEFLRDYVHLRPRTNTFSAIARIRNALAFATHTFFQDNEFFWVQTPIITTIDCEGAGEMFQVSTLLNEAEKIDKELIKNPPPSQEEVDAAKDVVRKKGEIVAKLKSEKSGKSSITAAVGELTKAKESLSKVEGRFNQKPGIPKKDGKVDYGQDFFAREAFLNVSGQLHAETFACALSGVYTFGPTFRAENSHTSRHLAEFWMVEPEIAFADIEDDMNCAEAYIRFLCQWLLDKCLEDMKFMRDNFDKNAITRLQMVAKTKFKRLSYTDAVKILEEAVSKGHKFENKVEWGIDLASEHEKYLTETKFKSPVIVYDYPKGIKAFYMKLNPDKKTVAAMDVLVPKVGELIGGSQREENYEVIKERILEMGLPLEQYEWYLDTRRYGSMKHSGFGLGFERMILFATGIDNIRDVIPFPRIPGRADL